MAPLEPTTSRSLELFPQSFAADCPDERIGSGLPGNGLIQYGVAYWLIPSQWKTPPEAIQMSVIENAKIPFGTRFDVNPVGPTAYTRCSCHFMPFHFAIPYGSVVKL